MSKEVEDDATLIRVSLADLKRWVARFEKAASNLEKKDVTDDRSDQIKSLLLAAALLQDLADGIARQQLVDDVEGVFSKEWGEC